MITVTSPLAGRAVGLAAVPDPLFAGALVGYGTAIDPVREPIEAVASIDGVVISVFPHAYVITDEAGHAVLTHLGVNTVQLAGSGFELLVSKGERVERGRPVVRWNPVAVEATGRSPISPVVALSAPAEALSAVAESGEIVPGAELFIWK